MSCNYKNQFITDFKNYIFDLYEKGTPAEEILSAGVEFLKSVREKAQNAGVNNIEEYLEHWSKVIDKTLLKYKVPALGAEKIQSLILGNYTTVEYDTPATTATLDVEMQQRSDYRKDFIDRIYQGAEEAKRFAVKQSEIMFNNALLFDRDTKTITTNDSDLNHNIRKLQQQLFETVLNYIRNYYSDKENQIEGQNYDSLNEELQLYKDNKYTGAFEIIFNEASSIFNTFDKSRLLREYSFRTRHLKAFNAFQMLTHFDEFMILALGDNIKIYNLNERFSDDFKYSLTAKASNMFWTNGDNDDIDVSKSINNLSKIIIQTSKLYDFNTGNSISDEYLTFGQYIAAITKLKDLAWDQKLSRNIKLNYISKFGGGDYDMDSLSSETREYIKSLGPDATLATLINLSRDNARQAYSALFEFLYEFRNNINIKKVWKKFNNEEKNVLTSLYKEIFGIGQERSLRSVQDANGYTNKNILNIILQTTDSTWLVKNCQYFQDAETKDVILRTLLNSNIDKIKFDLRDLLNIQNSPKISKAYTKYSASYNRGFHFTYNGKRFTIKTDGNLIVEENGKFIPFSQYLENKTPEQIEKEFTPFLDDMLHQNFKNNKKLLENYYSIKEGKQKTSLEELILFSAELLHGQFAIQGINDTIDQNLPDDVFLTKKDKIEKYYNSYYNTDYYGSKVKVKFKYKTIDIVPSKLLHVLTNLAEARAITDGVSTATQTNDSEGKALSNSTPSRLLSTFQHQFEVIRRSESSPAKEFTIVSDPNILLDVQTVREYKSSLKDSKIFNKFNTREFLESSILYDFLMPLINPDTDYNLPSKGAISITPSVNSDKNTISKMIINLEYVIKKLRYEDTKGGESAIQKFLKNPDSSELIDYANSELKKYYSTMIDNINEDLKKLSESTIFKNVLGSDFILKYTPESYKELNEKLAERNLRAVQNNQPKMSVKELFYQASKETGVALNEQLHTVYTKKGVTINNSLYTLYLRHTNDKEANDILTKFKAPTSADFWKYKNTELLQSLVNNKVFIDAISNKDLYNFLKSSGLEEWISSSGKLIFGKYKGVDITSEADLIRIQGGFKNIAEALNGQELRHNPHLLANGLKLNPLLEKQNILSYLYSQEFILSTVGSHVNHPFKKALPISEYNSIFDFLSDEAARFQAQHKRNVSMTASVHEFLLNTLEGIPTQYNIACIEDIKELVYNIFGQIKDVKPFDGATFVNPFIVYLENNSLEGERAGNHKKQFVHYYDKHTGTGGIIKTAGFGLNNNWMRNSELLQIMMKNMTDIPWTDKEGNPIYVDITKSIQNSDAPSDLKYKIYRTKPVRTSLGKYTLAYEEVTKINYKGDGIYELTIRNVRKDGVTYYPDAEGNMEKVITTGPLDSNYKIWKEIFGGLDCASINPKTNKLSNKVEYGEASILNMVKAITSCGKLLSGERPVDQNFYQPMKHSDTHYLVTEGAIKQGGSNTNSNTHYYKRDSYNRFKIDMTQAGIQLDKSHNADNAEISMMTQVISACAALGFNFKESSNLYKALESLAMEGVSDIAEALSNSLGEVNSTEFQQQIATMLVKQLINSSKDSDGMVYTLTKNLIDIYREKRTLTKSDIEKNRLALSDRTIFNKISSMLTSGLTKMAIKLKFSGTLSVLVPSHEIMKIYGGKLRGNFINFAEEILEMQNNQPIIDISKVEMGRTYRIVDDLGNIKDTVLIQSPIIDDGIYGNPNTKFVGYYDLKKKFDKGGEYQGLHLIEDVTVGRNLGAYFCTFSDGENSYNFYDLYDSYMLYNPSKDNVSEKARRDHLQNTLKNLKNGSKVTVYVEKDGEITAKEVTVSNLEIKPYEIIMPKVFAENLGLTEEDDLYTLVHDKEIFTKKLVSNIASKISNDENYTVILKRLNGKHTYLLTPEQFESKADKKQFIKTEVANEYIVEGQTVIVTDNIMEYINTEEYSLLSVSNAVDASALYPEISKSSNKRAQKWVELVGKDINKNSAKLNKIVYENGEITPIEVRDLIQTLGQELYTSFKKTLDVIAARIPAQSMQSFMPMKVIAYEDFDINNAYVSAHQIWLQGSDYDIDCVSLLLYELNKNGTFAGWSPYFDVSSEENLKISEKFNFPSGKPVKFIEDINRVVTDLLEEEMDKIEDESPFSFNNKLASLGIQTQVSSYRDVKKFKALVNLYLETVPVSTELEAYNWANDQMFNSIDEWVGEDLIARYIKKLLKPFYIVHNNDNIQLSMTDNLQDLVDCVNWISDKGLFDIKNASANLRQLIVDTINQEYQSKQYNPEGQKEPIIDYDTVDALFDSIAEKVNKHNNYINSKQAPLFTKNYVVEQIFKIAMNPSNLLQLQQSVDKTTDEPKAIADQSQAAIAILKNATPGNMGNIFQSIEDNHVGKEVIGISAVGLKSFFALTQYVNTILNSKDTDKINKLLNQKPLNFAGKEYRLIANANSLNADILSKLRELNSLGEGEYQKDAALLISALLSLATDNAKELCLSKLNANAKMAGMYIYGLTMGISFQDLGKLLMSDIGDTVSQYLKGSIITDKLNLTDTADVIRFLQNPISKIKEAYKGEKLWEFNTGKPGSANVWNSTCTAFSMDYKTSTGLVNAVAGVYTKDSEEYKFISQNKIATENVKNNQFETFLNKAFEKIKKGELDSLTLVNILEVFKSSNLLIGNNVPQNKQLKNQLIEALQDAAISVGKVYNTTIIGEQEGQEVTFEDFIKLYEGAEEMKAMGQLAGFNQGLKNGTAEFLKQINNFEEIINNRLKVAKISNNATGERTRINFDKFIKDSEYREEMIKAYDDIKFSFNILEAITTVPHYNGYLYIADQAHQSLMQTIRGRTIYNNLVAMQNLLGIKDLDQNIKSIDKLIDYKLINSYFINNNIKFLLPEKGKIISVDEENGVFVNSESDATKPTWIYLGTQGGNATFKNFMEQIVIPDLKQGIIRKEGIRSPAIANNSFIKSLRPGIYSLNASKNTSISQTTDINMSPKNEEDKNQLSRLRQAFNNLSGSYTIENVKIPIKDLFYFYNLIAYGDAVGQGSLTTIFDDYKETSSEYAQYQKEIDQLDCTKDVFHLTDQELITWGTQLQNPYSSYNKYIYYKNMDTLNVEMMSIASEEDWEMEEVRKIGKYKIDNRVQNINWDLILQPPTQTDVKSISMTVENKIWKISYNPITRKVVSMASKEKDIGEDKLKELNSKNLLIKYDPIMQEYQLDNKIIESLIKTLDCNK